MHKTVPKTLPVYFSQEFETFSIGWPSAGIILKAETPSTASQNPHVEVLSGFLEICKYEGHRH